jgi:hypothetical protein
VEGSDPARRRIQMNGRHLTFVTRISPFAGRVTETALRGNTKPSVERDELRPTATRMTCSDVHASAARRHKVSGRQQAGAHQRFTLSRKRTCQSASSTRSLPTDVASRVRQRMANAPSLAARSSATDRSSDAPPDDDEGAIERDTLHRSSRSVRKRSRASAIRTAKLAVRWVWRQTSDRVCEDSRVRECDLITCCVASPPRCPSDRHRPWLTTRLRVWPLGFTRLPQRSAGVTQRAKASSAGVAPYRSRGAR